MQSPATSRPARADDAVRILVLAFGGAAALQWVHIALLGAGVDDLASVQADWLRNGAIALPFVAAAVLLASRRSTEGSWAGRAGVGVAALYATIAGGGTILATLFPLNAHTSHNSHDAGELHTLVVLGHAAAMMAAAAVYAMVTDCVVRAMGGTLNLQGERFMPRSRFGRAVAAVAAAFTVVSVAAITGNEKAAAQTSFPDQAIHPRGSLTLIAQTLPDGSMGYVAPEYGTNGVRPTIEMAEGETLNITLRNQLNSDVSLHVHGVHYNPDSDGTRHSNSVVKPGQQRMYQWRAAPGTSGYWHYHDHVIGDDEGTGGILGGLYGALVVRKPGDPKPARTFVIVGHDKTLNGRIYPDTPTYTARQGELVEWVVVSHGNRVHTFHLHGHRWLTPNRPSDPGVSAAANAGSGHEDNHILAPGDSFGFLVLAGEGVAPGMWMYHCHFQDHASAMKGFFQVLPPAGGGDPGSPRTQGKMSRFFKETGKTVAGRFLQYWIENGGLVQQGFPISDEFMEKSDLDGKTYRVQYFERAVFELHPENEPPHDVLLSQLGTFRYKEKYPNGR
jgi:hypothetical protein